MTKWIIGINVSNDGEPEQFVFIAPDRSWVPDPRDAYTFRSLKDAQFFAGFWYWSSATVFRYTQGRPAQPAKEIRLTRVDKVR